MPDQPSVQCQTTKGPIDIVIHKEWSPRGADRFMELVEAGFFRDIPLFRCVDDFLCQFGYKEPSDSDREWTTILDDPKSPVTPKRFKRGYVSFAGGGPNTRDSHLFVTLGEDVSSLGRELWETPLGYVTDDSMARVVSKWTTKYGDMPPWGGGPDPGKIARKGGSAYLKRQFPDLDYILSCKKLVPAEDLAKKARIALELAPNLGTVVIELEPDWSPLGVRRLLDMLNTKYLDEARFFRVVPGFVVQFGMPADPKRGKEFPQIKDDPVKATNERGTITFATSGANTRTTQLFINLGNNARLDGMGFAPIGRVVEGMNFVDKINPEYREAPDQSRISEQGNEYLNKNFPRLSYIKHAYVVDVNQPMGVVNDAEPHTTVMFEAPVGRDRGVELMVSLAMVLALILGFSLAIRVFFHHSTKPKN